MTFWTEDRYLSMAQLYSNGKNLDEIADMTQFDVATIKTAFRLLRQKYGGQNTAHLLCNLLR
jgi:DNA-binding CsgD family transcriptional regulator